MDTTTTPKFDYLDKFPREIRDIIFGYMVQDTIESYRRPINHDALVSTDGLDTSDAQAHLISSPWVTLNKQYCAEYLQVFVREVELRRRFTSQCGTWIAPLSSHPNSTTKPKNLAGLKNVLQLVTQRFDIAGAHAETETSSKKLLSRIRGICFSYQYPGLYFQRGFGTEEQRQYPPRDFLKAPLRLLRHYHEKTNIPSNRLSIEISYGDASCAFLACLGFLDPGMSDSHNVSFKTVQARIQVDDHDASVATIDKELEVLKEAVGNLTEKLRSRYSMRHELPLIQRLESMIDLDVTLLRFHHLRAIDQVTKSWAAPDGGREVNESPISLPPLQHPIWRSDQILSLIPHQANENDCGTGPTILAEDDDEAELDDLSAPISNHHEAVCVTIDGEENNQDDPNDTSSIQPLPQALPPPPSCCGLKCILM